MNKYVALTVVGVILLGMALVAYNEYSTEPQPTEIAQSAMETPQAPAQEANNAPPAELVPPKAQSPATDVNKSANALTPPTAAAPVEDLPQNAIPAEPAPTTPATAATSTSTDEPAKTIEPEKQEEASKAEDEVAPTDNSTSTEAAKVQTEEAKPEAEKVEIAKQDAKPEQANVAVDKVINKISILSIGDGVTVRIDSSLSPAYKSMQLKDPPRIVLDLTGDWKVKAPGVPKNDFVTNVRIGQQKDGTRIVVDLKKTPASVRYLKYGDTGLDVRIR